LEELVVIDKLLGFGWDASFAFDADTMRITVSVIRPEQADSDIINLEVGGDMSIELLKGAHRACRPR
jgi:hypothetical protein